MRGLETGLDGWSLPRNWKRLSTDKLIYNLRVPNPDRMLAIKQVGQLCMVHGAWCMRGAHSW